MTDTYGLSKYGGVEKLYDNIPTVKSRESNHKLVGSIIAGAKEIFNQSPLELQTRLHILELLLFPMLSCVSTKYYTKHSSILNSLVSRAPRLLTMKESRLKSNLCILSSNAFNISRAETVEIYPVLHLIQVPLQSTSIYDSSQLFFSYPRLLTLPLSVFVRLRFVSVFNYFHMQNLPWPSDAGMRNILSLSECIDRYFIADDDTISQYLDCNTKSFVKILTEKYIQSSVTEQSDIDDLYSTFLVEAERYVLCDQTDNVFSKANSFENGLRKDALRTSEQYERQLCNVLCDNLNLCFTSQEK